MAAFSVSVLEGRAQDLLGRLDFRSAVQVHAAEPNSRVGRGGEKIHCHPVSAVEAHPLEAHGFPQSLLLWHATHLTVTGTHLASLGA